MTTAEYSAVACGAMRSTTCHSCIPLAGLRQRGPGGVGLVASAPAHSADERSPNAIAQIQGHPTPPSTTSTAVLRSTWGVYTPSWRSAKAAAVPTQ